MALIMIGLIAGASMVRAAVETDESIVQRRVRVAQIRAHDFEQRYLAAERAERARLAQLGLQKAAEARALQSYEDTRRKYAARPRVDQSLRLEVEDQTEEARLAKREARLEINRRNYVRLQERLRQALERSPQIDASAEFGLLD